MQSQKGEIVKSEHVLQSYQLSANCQRMYSLTKMIDFSQKTMQLHI